MSCHCLHHRRRPEISLKINVVYLSVSVFRKPGVFLTSIFLKRVKCLIEVLAYKKSYLIFSLINRAFYHQVHRYPIYLLYVRNKISIKETLYQIEKLWYITLLLFAFCLTFDFSRKQISFILHNNKFSRID